MRLFANNATSSLASGINDSDNTLLLATGEGARFPAPIAGDYFDLTLTQGIGLETSWEIVKVTARSGDTLTVARGQEGTAAAAWAAGAKAELRLTKGAMEEAARQVTLSGNLTLYATQSTTLTITNFDSATTYSVSATGGTATVTGDQITYTAGATAGTYAITINGRAVPVTVEAAVVVAPTITSPANGATGLGQSPTFTTSDFATIGVADTFLNADHEIRTGPNGTGTLIASSYADASSETSWTMPGNLLVVATQYYYRKLHRGTALGASGWSEVSFTTAATFGGLIGTQGGQGFGVGICANQSLLVARGLSAMTGTDDKAHANHGNYQHTNGGIVCYVPKFFYRIGHTSSL